jgi:hypothetical protein
MQLISTDFYSAARLKNQKVTNREFTTCNVYIKIRPNKGDMVFAGFYGLKK